MTYKQGCLYAAYLGVPCLIFDVIARMPPFFHMEGAHVLAEAILFPGWQVVHWLTGGLTARTFEYKLLLPLLIVGINILVWGAVVWSIGNVIESRRRTA